MKLVLLAFLFTLHSAAFTNAARRIERTSSSEITISGNPCFQQPSSAACVAYVADKRGVSLAQARSLITHAARLYASETTPSAALYDRSAVAVACLASRGTLRPGPDENCAECGSTCYAESRPEVCELYCAIVERDTSTNEVNFEAVSSLTARQTETEYFSFGKATADSSIFNSVIAWKIMAFTLTALILFVAFIAACVLYETIRSMRIYLRSSKMEGQNCMSMTHKTLYYTIIAHFNLFEKLKTNINISIILLFLFTKAHHPKRGSSAFNPCHDTMVRSKIDQHLYTLW